MPAKRIKRFLPAALLCFTFFLSPLCRAQNEKTSLKEQLIFQSGFEGNSRVVTEPGTNDYGALLERLAGKDTRYTQQNDSDNSLKNFTTRGTMQVQYTGGDSSQRFARIISEPGNPNNHVLQYWLNDSWLASEGQQKARIQTNLYGIKEGLKEFYQSVKVFIPEDFNVLKSYPQKIGWCTISEFWNNEWWVKGEPYGFRITLGIGKPAGITDQLNFILEAENPGQKLVWRAEASSSDITVPIGKWFTMEYYFKEGNADTGRFYLAITPDKGQKRVVYDVHNFTHMTQDPAPGGLTGYNPMKLYTSKELVKYVKDQGKTLQIYWDDFQLWKNKRP
ncbi:hypothetical protein ACX0G7_12675 [Flavitalea antarctica]